MDEVDTITAVKDEDVLMTKVLNAIRSVAPSLIYDRSKALRKRRSKSIPISSKSGVMPTPFSSQKCVNG